MDLCRIEVIMAGAQTLLELFWWLLLIRTLTLSRYPSVVIVSLCWAIIALSHEASHFLKLLINSDKIKMTFFTI